MSGTTAILAHALATSPPWIYALLMLGLALHIGGGIAAIVAGYAAVTVRKGERLHRLYGKIFVAAMFTMTSAAFTMAIYLGEKTNIGAAVLAAYLTATAWLTIQRGDGEHPGWPERAAMLAIAGTALVYWVWAFEARARGSLDGFAPVLFYVFASVASLLALLDIKVLWRGGVSGVQRIARHLWRMSFAFFFAAGSFFLGQQKIMPKAWHGSAVLWVLGLTPLAVMIFWLIRVRIGNRFRHNAAAMPAE